MMGVQRESVYVQIWWLRIGKQPKLTVVPWTPQEGKRVETTSKTNRYAAQHPTWRRDFRHVPLKQWHNGWEQLVKMLVNWSNFLTVTVGCWRKKSRWGRPWCGASEGPQQFLRGGGRLGTLSFGLYSCFSTQKHLSWFSHENRRINITKGKKIDELRRWLVS